MKKCTLNLCPATSLKWLLGAGWIIELWHLASFPQDLSNWTRCSRVTANMHHKGRLEFRPLMQRAQRWRETESIRHSKESGETATIVAEESSWLIVQRVIYDECLTPPLCHACGWSQSWDIIVLYRNCNYHTAADCRLESNYRTHDGQDMRRLVTEAVLEGAWSHEGVWEARNEENRLIRQRCLLCFFYEENMSMACV